MCSESHDWISGREPSHCPIGDHCFFVFKEVRKLLQKRIQVPCALFKWVFRQDFISQHLFESRVKDNMNEWSSLWLPVAWSFFWWTQQKRINCILLSLFSHFSFYGPFTPYRWPFHHSSGCDIVPWREKGPRNKAHFSVYFHTKFYKEPHKHLTLEEVKASAKMTYLSCQGVFFFPKSTNNRLSAPFPPGRAGEMNS